MFASSFNEHTKENDVLEGRNGTCDRNAKGYDRVKIRTVGS